MAFERARKLSFLYGMSVSGLRSLSARRDHRVFKLFPAGLLFLYVILTPVSLKAYADASDFTSLPTDSLLEEGKRCMKVDTLEKRGEIIYNVVVNRFYRNPEDNELKKAAIVALSHLGTHYVTHDIDYRKAYKNLQLARQLASDMGDEYQLSYILNSLASLYSANILDNDSIGAMADRLLLEALQAAVDSDNRTMMSAIGINIGVKSFLKGSWGIFEDGVHAVCSSKSKVSKDMERTKAIIRATDAYFSKSYEECEAILTGLYEQDDDTQYSERFYYTMDILLLTLYQSMGRPDDAADIMKSALDKAKRNQHKDYIIYMLYHLYSHYQTLGQDQEAERYYSEYLRYKDVLREESGYGEIESLDFLAEIERANKELEALSVSHHEAKRNLLILLAVLVVVSIILLALMFVHFHLRKTNRNLFEHHQETLKREAQHRLLMEESERERQHLEDRISELTSFRKSDEAASISSAAPSEVKEDGEEKADDNDETSSRNPPAEDMDDEGLKTIYAKVLIEMEKSPRIFESGFSLNDLSALLGIYPRLLSRTINVCHNSNFHQLLNEFRLREVTRLMHDPSTSNLTIEAIAERVGFKSRTSFSRLFKSSVGLTPSEYLKMAKQS